MSVGLQDFGPGNEPAPISENLRAFQEKKRIQNDPVLREQAFKEYQEREYERQNKLLQIKEERLKELRDQRFAQLVKWKRANGPMSRPDGKKPDYPDPNSKYWAERVDVAGFTIGSHMREKAVIDRFVSGMPDNDTIDHVASLLVQQENYEKNKTFGSQVFDVASLLPSYMVPFLGSSKAVTGLGKLGTKAVVKGSVKAQTTKLGKAAVATDNLIRAGVTGATNTAVRGSQFIAKGAGVAPLVKSVPLVKHLPGTAGKAALQAPMMPKLYATDAVDSAKGGVYLDENDDLFVQEGTDISSQIPAALARSYIETFSERFGGDVLSKMPIWNGMKTFLGRGAQKILRKSGVPTTRMATAVTKKLAESGYNGVLEEMVEERVGEMLRLAADLGDTGVIGNLSAGIAEGDPDARAELFRLAREQIYVEAVAFSVPGAAGVAYTPVHESKPLRKARTKAARKKLEEDRNELGVNFVDRPDFAKLFNEAYPKDAKAIVDHYKQTGELSRKDFQKLATESGFGNLRFGRNQRKEMADKLMFLDMQRNAYNPQQQPNNYNVQQQPNNYNVQQQDNYNVEQQPNNYNVQQQGNYNAEQQPNNYNAEQQPNNYNIQQPAKTNENIAEEQEEEVEESNLNITEEDLEPTPDPPVKQEQQEPPKPAPKQQLPPRILKDLKKYGYEFKVEEIKGYEQMTAKQFANSLGKELFLVTHVNQTEERFFSGYNLGNAIVINKDLLKRKGVDAFWATFGHELAHATEIDKINKLVPKEWQEQESKKIRPRYHLNPEYQKRLDADPGLVKRETVARYIQNFWSNKEFRDEMFSDPANYSSIESLTKKTDEMLRNFSWLGNYKANKPKKKLIAEVKSRVARLKVKARKNEKVKEEFTEEDLEQIALDGINAKFGKKPAKVSKSKKKKTRAEIVAIEKKGLSHKARKQREWLFETAGRQQVPDETSDNKYKRRRWKTVAELVKSVEAGYTTDNWENYLEETGLTLEEAFNHVLKENVKKPPKPKATKPKATKKKATKKKATKPSSNEEKADKAKSESIIDDDLAADLDAFKNAIDGNISMGVDPKLGTMAAKIVAKMVNRGVRKFSNFVRTLRNHFNDDSLIKKMAKYLEAGWDAIKAVPKFSTLLDESKSIKGIINDSPAIHTEGNNKLGEPSREGGGREDAEGTGTEDGDIAGSDSTGVSREPSDLSGGLPGDSNTSLNFRLDEKEIGKGGLRTKYKENIAALKLLRQLQEEGKDQATLEQQKVLSKWVGWGMFPGVFHKTTYKLEQMLSDEAFEENKPDKWKEERKEVADLLGGEASAEWQAAFDSTINAHYTSPTVVKTMWEMLKHMGFNGGSILEPSVGSGNFLGLQPEHMAVQSNWVTVEKDITTAQIQGYLYPEAKAINKPFEEVVLQENYFDLAISNFPFGDIQILADREYAPIKPNIHDYFFLKSLDYVRPGGLVAAITSTGTMDKKQKAIRNMISGKADLVASFRLPSGTFGKNAGTSVVTDLIILRKLDQNETPSGPSFTNLGEVEEPNGGDVMQVNEYYVKNPRSILGKLERGRGMYGPNEVLVTMPKNITQKLNSAISNLPENTYEERADIGSQPVATLKTTERDGQLLVKEGKIFRVVGDMVVSIENTGKPAEQKKRLAIIRDIGPVRNAWVNNINAQIEGKDRDTKDKMRSQLREEYSKFVSKHGPISERSGVRKFLYPKGNNYDGDYLSLAGLELYTPTRGKNAKGVTVGWASLAKTDLLKEPFIKEYMADESGHYNGAMRPLDASDFTKEQLKIIMQNEDVDLSDAMYKDTIAPQKSRNADTAHAAAMISKIDKGRVDPNYVAELLGTTEDLAIEKLKEDKDIFFDPSKGYMPREMYLSGDVRTKLAQAEATVDRIPELKRNIEEIKKVLPDNKPIDKIMFNLGSPWIPEDVRNQFMRSLVGAKPDHFKIRFFSQTGRWSFNWTKQGVRAGVSDSQSVKEFEREVDFTKTINAVLQRRSFKVVRKNKVTGEVSKEETAESTLAQRKVQDEIEREFKDFVASSDKIADTVEDAYADNKMRIVRRKYTADFLTFPGMNPAVQLRPWQKRAVARGVERGNAIFAHEVGAGKTFTMIATAMELKRLGLKNKTCIAVPLNRIADTVREAKFLYPSIRIFAADAKMSRKQREAALSKISANNFDIVVIGHTHLTSMPVSKESREEFMQEQIDELETILIAEAGKKAKEILEKTHTNSIAGITDISQKNLAKSLQKLRQKLKKLTDEKDQHPVNFDTTGIDALMIDESHNFKGMLVTSAMGDVKGVPSDDTQKAANTEIITRSIHERFGGRGVYFASGTPVTNSIAEIYVNMRFVQRKLLQEHGLISFDAWAANFATTLSRIELDHSNQVKNAVRMRELKNTNELYDLVQLDWDFVSIDETGQGALRPFKFDKIEQVPAGPNQAAYLDVILQRAKNLNPNNRKEDNHLMIAQAGAKAAMDIRMVEPDELAETGTKIDFISKKVLSYYDFDPTSVQMLFHGEATRFKTKATVIDDTGEEKETEVVLFDYVNEIIEKLVEGGIPRNQILDFRGIDNKLKQEYVDRLKEDGDASIAIGGTNTLGTGVDAPDRVIAMHQMEPGWTPHAKTQRDGRGWRQGNRYNKVMNHIYVTSPSMDRWKYGLVSKKDRSFKKFFSGARMESLADVDVDEIPSDFAVASALAEGDTQLMEEMNLIQDYIDLENDKQRFDSRKVNQRERLVELERDFDSFPKDVENLKKDLVTWNDNKDAVFDFMEFKPGTKDTVKQIFAEEEKQAAAVKIRERWKQTPADKIYNAIGMYKGFMISSSPNTAATLKTNPEPVLRLSGEKVYTLTTNFFKPGSDPARIFGEITRVMNLIEKTELETATARLESAKFDIDQLKTKIARDWADKAVLEQVRANLENVTRELNEKYPDRDQPSLGSIYGMSLLPDLSGLKKLAKGFVPQRENLTAPKFSNPTWAARKVINLQKFFFEFLTKEGLVDKTTFKLDEKRKASLSQIGKEMERNVKSAMRELRLYTVQSNASPQRVEHVRRVMVEVLTGNASMSSLPLNIATPVAKAVAQRDKLEKSIIDSKLLSAEQKANFMKLYGAYVTRAYEVHDNPYFEPEDALKQDALNWIYKNTKYNTEDAQTMLRFLVMKKEHPFVPNGPIFGTVDATPNRTILMDRSKFLSAAKPIRDYMGEYKDYEQIYARTVTNQAQLLVNFEFVESYVKAGMGSWLFTKPQDVPGSEAPRKLVDGDSKLKGFEQLKDLYAEPHVVQGLEDLLEFNKTNDWAIEALVNVIALPKVFKTVYSHPTQFRNFVSNFLISVSNGHIYSGGLEDFGKSFEASLNSIMSMDDAKTNDLVDKLQRLGIFENSFHGEVINDFKKDYQKQVFNSSRRGANPSAWVNAMGNALLDNKVAKVAQGAYQMGDEIWKAHAWMHEVKRYEKAFGGKVSIEKIEEIAAEIVKNTFPTYSRVPKGIKALRRFPLVGTFVAFPWELKRTQLATWNIATKELNSSNPEIRKIGRNRRLSQLTAHGMVGATVVMGMAAAGVGLDDWDSYRDFMPHWMKNSPILWLSEDMGIDIGYVSPFNVIHKPLLALFHGIRDEKNPVEASFDAGKEFFKPYFSEEIAFKALNEAINNTNEHGNSIANAGVMSSARPGSRAWNDEFSKLAGHVYRAFEPGSQTQFRKTYLALTGKAGRNERTFDVETELLANFFGRPVKIDVERSMKYKTIKLVGHINAITGEAKAAFASKGRKTEEALAREINLMENKRKAVFRSFLDFITSAMKIGYSEQQLEDIMLAAGAPRSIAKAALTGKYEPFQMSRIDQIKDMEPERAKQFAELTGGQQVVSRAVGRAVDTAIGRSPSKRKEAMVTVRKFSATKEAMIEHYKNYLNEQVSKRRITKKTAMAKFQRAFRLKLQ